MNVSNARVENGDSIIPASQRPDGTWRKARRVKEGYVPQEEVPLYESKGKQLVNRATKPQTITLPSGQVAHQTIPGLFLVAEKPKPKKKKSKNVEDVTKQMERAKLTDDSPTKAQTKSQTKKKTKTVVEQPPTEDKSSNASNQDVDPVKRLRNLKKRLREVEQLEEKLKKGLISKPEPEQLAKVLRKNYLQMQISELEKEV
ncbi:hypothetical protein RN001_013853 [Aquatica leii]|uniref:Partner of Y14 and mago n=1 Tax=Aquatica leii TaxID=1421715 RepID=A0AAN7P3C9_9COLE|nr:hypothetical protein RN001_013853 [Aquatica leii]